MGQEKIGGLASTAGAAAVGIAAFTADQGYWHPSHQMLSLLWLAMWGLGLLSLVLWVHAAWMKVLSPIEADQGPDLRDAAISNFELPTSKQAAKAVPDWPIRNLFFRLNPGLLQSKDRNDFEAVGEDIRDKLATGQLIAWGRAIDGSRTLPLYPIPEDYWLHAKLNMWLLDDEPGGGNILQAAPVDQSAPNKTQYREILINQAQALAEWPEPAAVPAPASTGGGSGIIGAGGHIQGVLIEGFETGINAPGATIDGATIRRHQSTGGSFTTDGKFTALSNQELKLVARDEAAWLRGLEDSPNFAENRAKFESEWPRLHSMCGEIIKRVGSMPAEHMSPIHFGGITMLSGKADGAFVYRFAASFIDHIAARL